MPLNESEIVSLDKYLEDTSAVQRIKKEVLVDKINEVFDDISKHPSMHNKPRSHIIKRVKSVINASISNEKQEGEEMVFMLFGPNGRSRDWNQDLFEYIKSEEGRGNVKGLIADDRIMTMMVDDKKVAVSKITKMGTVERWIDIADGSVHSEKTKEDMKSIKEKFVIDGEVWKKGADEHVIPRDHRVMNGSKNINYGWSAELRNSWQITIMGMGCLKEQLGTKDEDWRLIELTVRDSQADVNDKNFILKHYDPFQWYIGSFKISEKGTKGWKYAISSKTVVGTAFDNPFKYEDGDEMPVDEVIESLFNTLKEMFGKEAAKTMYKKDMEQLPDFLDGYSELEEYYEGISGFTGQVSKDKDGKVLRNPSGSAKLHYGKFGIMRADVTKLIEPAKEDGNYRFELSDSTTRHTMTVWSNNYVSKIPKPIPSTCLIMFSARRKPDRWDNVIRKRVPDSEKGELIIDMVTIGSIPTVEGLEIQPISFD